MIKTNEGNEIYNSIVREFELSSSSIKKMSELIEVLVNARIEICKLFKMQKFKAETFDESKKRLFENIDINKFNIKSYEKIYMEIKDKIVVNKEKNKLIKSHINKLDDRIVQEQLKSRTLREALRIFLSRDKFKFIKKLIFRKYKKIYSDYSSVLSIKREIKKCDERKKKIREEKFNFNNNIERSNKKIIAYKIELSEIRKSTINMSRDINSFIIKIQSLNNYGVLEKQFKIERLKWE